MNFVQTLNILPGNYNLTVKCGDYLAARPLEYTPGQYSLFIQMNKAIFLPEDLFQFRVFCIDSETYSYYPTDATTITLIGPKGNSIALFSNLTFVNGKYENEWRFSNHPVLGIWRIEVASGDEVSPLQSSI